MSCERERGKAFRLKKNGWRRQVNKEQYYHRLQHQEFKLTQPKPKAKPHKPPAAPFKANETPASTTNWQQAKKQYEDKEKVSDASAYPPSLELLSD